jgi:hypothetical protein
MIIGHEHRYVFVQLPRTGCTAVEKELLAQYSGQRILNKHSTYRDFLRHASRDERSYYVFSSIRNPLDDAVSHYVKMASDHGGRFSDPVRRRHRVGRRGAEHVRRDGTDAKGRPPARRSLAERRDNRMHHYITARNADFAQFFLRYHWLPYDNWSRLDHPRMNGLIRFEELEHSFGAVLAQLGIEQRRPLPVRNRTQAKNRDWQSYYTPRILPRARFVFGPYMQRWGYEFPQEWGEADAPTLAHGVYRALGPPRTLYWTRLRDIGRRR